MDNNQEKLIKLYNINDSPEVIKQKLDNANIGLEQQRYIMEQVARLKEAWAKHDGPL